MRTLSEHACFKGVQGFYSHESAAIGLPMKFAVFTPSQAKKGPVPALIYLAGLTCNEETFAFKAGAQRVAAELGLMLIAPDVSPRATGIEAADQDWDLGHGAGFYLDATQAPWSRHFRMESWLINDLLPLIDERFPLKAERMGICGHSMGGHGALTLALRHPGVFRSVSAFAPIAAASQCPWGIKAFTNYLGQERNAWIEYDASQLMSRRKNPYPAGILIDQGLADKFLDVELKPDLFTAACATAGQPITLRRHEAYDHSYHFIATFVADHLTFHHAQLSH